MTRIWIAGALGHIGQALAETLKTTEYTLIETDKDEVDITDMEQVLRCVNINHPDVIINCAGYNTSGGEIPDTDTAYRVNALGARNLAQAADSIQAKIIHLSTDDVFSRMNDAPYNEFDDPHPDDIYGKSKYAGEKFVTQLNPRHVIIRSSWIYGIGQDFINRVINAANDPDTSVLTLKTNRYAVPTSADELAGTIKLLIDNECYGVYHAVCTGGYCSRLEYAEEILRLTGLQDRLTVKLADNAPEKYSVLDNMMLRISGMPEPADWKKTLSEYIGKTGGLE